MSTSSPKWTSLSTMGSWVRASVLGRPGIGQWLGQSETDISDEAAASRDHNMGDRSHRQVLTPAYLFCTTLCLMLFWVWKTREL